MLDRLPNGSAQPTCAKRVPTHHSTPQAKGQDTRDVDVPAIGSHAGETILPLISQVGHYWVITNGL